LVEIQKFQPGGIVISAPRVTVKVEEKATARVTFVATVEELNFQR